MKCNLALCMKRTIDAVLILRRMQEEYQANGKKLYMCLVDLKKLLTKYPKSVGIGNEKGKSKVLIRPVMSLYEGAKTRVDSEMSQKLDIKV